MREIMKIKEKIQSDVNAISEFMGVKITEADERSFLAKYSDIGSTETEIFYKYIGDKLNIRYFDEWSEIDGYNLMETILDSTLDFLAVENEYNGVKMKSTEFSPTFTQLMNEYSAMSEKEQESEAGRLLFVEVMRNAPQSFNDMASNMAEEMGLVPEVSGYLDNGDPVYSLEDIAENLGISMDEAMEAAKEMGIEAQLINSDDVHRVN